MYIIIILASHTEGGAFKIAESLWKILPLEMKMEENELIN